MVTLIDAMMADKIKRWIVSMDIYSDWSWEDVECRMEDSPFQVVLRDGASKICFVFENTNFVVKWSTCGESEAMQEVEYYEDAKAVNLDKFFPKTEYFFSHNGIDFVVQEKVHVQAGDIYGKSAQHLENIARTVPPKMVDKVQKELNKVTGYTRHINTLWIACVLSLYGKKATKALCKFVQEHDINDLHGSNVGFKDNKPIILDFSGYHREY